MAPGERVLLWLPNSPDLAIAWRSVLRAGCVAVVAHHGAPLEKIRQLVGEIEPAAVVMSAALERESLGPSVRHLIQLNAEEAPGAIGLQRLIAEHPSLSEAIPRAADDIAYIQYTSGSTGTPKGVMTRHGAFAATLSNLRRRFARWRRPVRHLSVLPMSSSFGSLSLFEGLGRKCTHVVLDRFDPEEVLHMVQTHRIERTFLVPTMCEAILAVPDIGRFDLSSLRTVVCGGAVVPAALIERFRAACGIRIDVSYGMTGVGGVSRASPDSKSGSVGRPFGHLQAKVVDPQGRTVPAGEVGELMLYLGKGRAIEYWNSRHSNIGRCSSCGMASHRRSGPLRCGWRAVRHRARGRSHHPGRLQRLWRGGRRDRARPARGEGMRRGWGAQRLPRPGRGRLCRSAGGCRTRRRRHHCALPQAS